MFSRNRANGQNPETSLMFRRIRQMAVSGAKSAVSDCILFDISFDKNSSGDEIANVLVNDDIAHT